MALSDSTCPTDVSLNTDLYELTMAQGFWHAGLAESQGVFTASFRDCPFKGGYAVACGTEQILDLVKNFRFKEESLAYLSSLKAPGGGKLFQPAFIDYLKDFKPDLSIWAVQEGELVFPREPLVRVQGSMIACQLIETALLNLINFQTLVATKAARVVQAAQGRLVSDFGLRRAQGHDGGLSVARAAYIGGANSTSNCLAGKLYDIPVFGTHAHSWVMAFPNELDAFRAFAAASPKNCTLLLDTYEVREGVENAIRVAKEMETRGERLSAVRIDSGDLASIAKHTRRRLDEEGLSYVKISASNDLDEYTIQSLFAQGAPIDAFGVGTKLATCDPEPSLGGIYKLSAIKRKKDEPFEPVIKLSEQAYKRTIPGIQQVFRYVDHAGRPVGDMIVDVEQLPAKDAQARLAVDVLDPVITYDFSAYKHYELLKPLVDKGEAVREPQSATESRQYCQDALMRLDASHKRFLNPQKYPVTLEPSLAQLRENLTRSLREKALFDLEQSRGDVPAQG